MFRNNTLAIPIEVLILVLHRLELQDLYVFMKLSRVCRLAVERNEVWRRNYSYYLPLGNNTSNEQNQNWFQLFKEHYRPNKKFMYHFLKLYPACYGMGHFAQAKLEEIKTLIGSCKNFDEWLDFVVLLRKENRLFWRTDEIVILRSMFLALAQYVVDHISRTSDWHNKTEIVFKELCALNALDRIDTDANRNDQFARYTKKNQLLAQLASLKKNTRLEVMGCEEVFRQYFQGILEIDFQEFKRLSESNELGWVPQRKRLALT